MIIADKWKEYEVLDAAGGEKLERWGAYTLLRPDPQVIWEGNRKLPGWRKPNAHYHRSAKGGGEWEFFDLPEEWEISYVPLNLRFRLKPFKFKHTGLFPEQAANWDWFSALIRGAVAAGRSIQVLNLFAYTGGATLAAARAGAAVTHVDAAKGMVGWARENAALSGLGEAPIRWIVDDCLKFVEREARRGKRYDAVIMDPPSYGRGPRGELWKIKRPSPFLSHQRLYHGPPARGAAVFSKHRAGQPLRGQRPGRGNRPAHHRYGGGEKTGSGAALRRRREMGGVRNSPGS